MMYITKEAVKAFGEFTSGKFGDCGIISYRRKHVSGWLLLRFRFALWRMKTFRLFRKPLSLSDNAVK